MLLGGVALLGVGAIGWLLLRPADGISLGRPPDLNATTAAIDAAMPAALADGHVPGAEVAIAIDGVPVWSAGYGTTTPGGSTVRADTVFQVGSISKTVAAATIVRTAGSPAELDLPVSDRLHSWRLPADSPDPAAVTLRRLLSHTAGINVPGYLGLPAGRPLPSTAGSLQGESGSEPVRQVAGAGSYSYSGGGYTIAQLAAEDTAGIPFAQLAQRQVLTPLTMSHSGYGCHDGTTGPRNGAAGPDAQGHDAAGARTPAYRYPEAAAAGMCSTAGDLALLGAWLATDDQVAVRMRTAADGTGGHYGLGVEIDDTGVVGHIGVNRGFYARLLVNPADQVVLAVVTNGDNGRSIVDAVLAAWHHTD